MTTTTNIAQNATATTTVTAQAAPRLNKKAVNAASKGIAQNVNAKAKALKAERKSINAILSALATSDSAESADFRAFLNLPKNANKAARKACATWLSKRYINVCRKVYVAVGDESDAVNVEASGVEPCNSKGRPYADYLDAIRDVVKAYEIAIARRNEIARQMWSARAAMIGKGMYDSEHKSAILTYAIGAPAKYQPQKVHGDVIFRK